MEKCRKSAENPKYITHEKNILEKATRVGKNRNTAFCKMVLDNLQKEELEDTGRLRNTLKSKKSRSRKKSKKAGQCRASCTKIQELNFPH